MRTGSWSPEGINVRQLREQERALERQLRIVRKLLGTLETEGVGGPPRKRRPRENTRLSQIVAVLKDEGRPLPIQAIYQRLQEKDPGLTWKQPAAAFRSYLRDQEEGAEMVVRVGRGMYALKAWEGDEARTETPQTEESEIAPWDDE